MYKTILLFYAQNNYNVHDLFENVHFSSIFLCLLTKKE